VDVFWTYLSLVDERVAAAAAAILVPMAIYILVSGLDDLLVDLAWLRLRRGFRAALAVTPTREPNVALFIPCWQESGVIGQMLEHNLAAIAWNRYQVFVGAYPNDPETIDAIRELKRRYPRVHLALAPHNGPTSKPDCLNWIYRRMEEVEQEQRSRFDLVLLHDAEDVIHPLAIARLAYYAETAGMVQLAVLPMPTPGSDWTHGVYCDDFAESQGKDLATRNALGAFVPGCGVGTCFRRDALELLASGNGGAPFQPEALTEDYDTGLRLYRLGIPQTFVPLEFIDGAPLATREYFPRRVGAAVRQRTRWVTGNALQSWQRHGWPGGWMNRWYLWRDRKGLWGNPLSLLCNVLLLYGLASWTAHGLLGSPWALGDLLGRWPGAEALMLVTSGLFLARLAFRTAACARVYGWRFAAGVPLRMLWGNWINCQSTVRALGQFVLARAAGREFHLRSPQPRPEWPGAPR
jgi:bacteriophage N4 adsorption protein B